MNVIKRAMFAGHEAVMFADRTVMWAGITFPGGMGLNLGLKRALELA